MDGDGRGGAALSMRAVTGLPIKFLGVGEKLDGSTPSTPAASPAASSGRATSSRWSRRQGRDRQAEAERWPRSCRRVCSTWTIWPDQLRQMQRMGGLGGMMGLMPGRAEAKEADGRIGRLDDRMLKRQEAIIMSMTPRSERRKPDLLNASRKRRIAAGAGVDVAEVNKPAEDAPADGRHDEEDAARAA
jgi:signal recognition particle subunit SRP54